jgi:hypothetical protein
MFVSKKRGVYTWLLFFAVTLKELAILCQSSTPNTRCSEKVVFCGMIQFKTKLHCTINSCRPIPGHKRFEIKIDEKVSPNDRLYIDLGLTPRDFSCS